MPDVIMEMGRIVTTCYIVRRYTVQCIKQSPCLRSANNAVGKGVLGTNATYSLASSATSVLAVSPTRLVPGHFYQGRQTRTALDGESADSRRTIRHTIVATGTLRNKTERSEAGSDDTKASWNYVSCMMQRGCPRYEMATGK